MKIIGIVIVIAALLSPSDYAGAQSSKFAVQVGEEYELSKSYNSANRTSDGSSGSSSGKDTILERVIGVREGGLELEYDLPKSASPDERARNWQFPARVYVPSNGPMQLMNGNELEVRVDGWLKAAKWTRSMCGRWIFTWNAFRIECDPQSVIRTIEEFDLRSADLRDGASYRDKNALSSGTLARAEAGPDGATFAATMQVDPNTVRRALAESDRATGEILQKPVTLDDALRERAKSTVRGTITVTFGTDSSGNVQRRTKVTTLVIKQPDGQSENRTSTEIVERRLVSTR